MTAVLATTLVACGGGGGGGNTGGGVTTQHVVTSVPTASYTVVDSATAATLINDARLAQGAGLVAQSTALDTIADNHTQFLIDNNLVADATYLTTDFSGTLGGHYEDVTKPGYTGETPQARATAAGYAGSVTEIITFGAADGTACMAALENSVYHLTQLMSPFIDIGLTFNPGNGSGSVCAIELGTPNSTLGQYPAEGNTVVYPFGGKIDVQPRFYNQAEAPNPATDLTIAGHPVAVSLYTQSMPSLTGSDVVIYKFLMTTAAGATVSARVLANSGVLTLGPTLTTDDAIDGAGYVVLLPVVPLDPNTVYNVEFAATVKEEVINKNWLFTTGNLN